MFKQTPIARKLVLGPKSRPAVKTCCALAVLTFGSAIAADEPPAIERLVPPGGQRGTSVDVKFIGKAGDGQLKILTEADSLSFTVAENRESATVAIAAAARPGIHWLRFSNEFGATELKPFVVGLIPEATEKEPNARMAEAEQVLTPSVTINGGLEKAGDVDTFGIVLTKGQTLVAAMHAQRGLGSPMDGVLQVLNHRGTVVAQNDDDTGPDPGIAYLVPSDGAWYVRTFAFPATPNSTIGFAGGSDFVYRLTLTTEPVIEHTSPMARSSRDAETALTLYGWNLRESVVKVPIDQSVLAEGFGLPSLLRTVGAESLTEVQSAEDQVLSLPIAVTGHIAAVEERDQYILHAVQGQKLSIFVDAVSLGSMLDPVLAVHDMDGKLIKENDDASDRSRDAKLDLTMPAAGACRITVRDRFSHSGDRWFYLLRCEETHPGYSAMLKATAFTLMADKPLEIPVTIDRRQGFAEAIEFRIEDLPEGVTAECARSEKDGDSAKAVTFKLTAHGAQATQKPIRIVAESVESKQQQPVTFEVPEGAEVSELWLTVR